MTKFFGATFLIGALLAAFLFVSDGVQTNNPNENVNPTQLETAINNKASLVIDIRTPDEWREGVIAGSKLLEMDDILKGKTTLPKDKPIIIYCRSGNRTGQTLNILKNSGYNNISHLKNGIISWAEEGKSIVKPDFETQLFAQ